MAEFIGHFQLLITAHYGAVTNGDFLHFTAACTESSQSAVSSAVL
jgi:hypothetical protein